MFNAFSLLKISKFPLGLLGSILGCFWGVFGSSLGALGVSLDPFGHPWEALWDHCGDSWPPLGGIFEDFGVLGAPIGSKMTPEGEK